MPDEITVNPAPVDTPIPQAPETLNPAPAEAVVVPTPTEPVPASTPTPEPSSGHLGGNDPIEPATAESTSSASAVETPTPETPEVTTPETTPAQVVASVVAPVVATLNSPRLGASGEASATRIEASPQAPLAENINSQTFTKSIRELFTKAQLSIQNRKRKKLDRILTLFAKQTMITNNEVEKLLHVSDATATRYLSALEKEGKIIQNKKTGKGVSYSKI